MIKGTRVTVPLFELHSNPTVQIADVKKWRMRRDVPCPVCGECVDDLLGHCMSRNDVDHAVAVVHIS